MLPYQQPTEAVGGPARISAPRRPRRAPGREGKAARFASARRLVGSRSPAGRSGGRWRLDSAPTFCPYSSRLWNLKRGGEWEGRGGRGGGGDWERTRGTRRLLCCGGCACGRFSRESRVFAAAARAEGASWSSLSVLSCSRAPVALFFLFFPSPFLCLINNQRKNSVLYLFNSKYSLFFLQQTQQVLLLKLLHIFSSTI